MSPPLLAWWHKVGLEEEFLQRSQQTCPSLGSLPLLPPHTNLHFCLPPLTLPPVLSSCLFLSLSMGSSLGFNLSQDLFSLLQG